MKLNAENDFLLNNNISIALFMGVGESSEDVHGCKINYIKGCQRLVKLSKNSRLKYHTSWDWIMPVVEEIEKMGVAVNITKEFILFDGFVCESLTKGLKYTWSGGCIEYSKIKCLWYGVVNFIDWYNKQSIPDQFRYPVKYA